MPADLTALDSHTKDSGSCGDDPSCGRLLPKFILTPLWGKGIFVANATEHLILLILLTLHMKVDWMHLALTAG